jgi:predicted nucleic acid-binding protein
MTSTSGETARDFLDSNVILYAYDRSAGDRHERAAELVSSLGRRRRGAVSVQVLQEFFVNATRKIEEPLPVRSARERVLVLGHWRTHSPRAADVAAAIDIHEKYGISFWDAMIVRSAAALGCLRIWSEDFNDGQLYERVQVRNPFT